MSDPYSNKTCLRTYKVPSRFFNVLFCIEDLQGDGFVRFTVICFYRGLQLLIPFNNSKRISFEFRLFN